MAEFGHRLDSIFRALSSDVKDTNTLKSASDDDSNKLEAKGTRVRVRRRALPNGRLALLAATP